MEEKIRAYLNETFAEHVIGEDSFRNQLTFKIKADGLISICESLYDHEDFSFTFLADITSVDWYGHAEEENGRFEVFYNLYSIANKQRLFLKVRLPGDDPEISSLIGIWRGADWLEREVWDMMGIKFTGHPNLTKILTPDELEGHPLRRDYPLTWEKPQFSHNKDQPPEVIK